LTAATILLLLTGIFFSPIVRYDATFSIIAGHQTAVWPWAAHPTGYVDTYPQSDAADTIYPWSVFSARALRDVEAPLWNPYSFGGTSFLTNGLGMSLYPPRVSLLLLVSPSWAHDLLLILHVFVGGLAMFALLRNFRCSLLPSLLSSISWMFASYLFAWIQLEFVVVLGVFLPATLLLTRLSSEKRSVYFAIAAGLALGLSIVGTSFQLAGPLLLIVGGYFWMLSLQELLGTSNVPRLRGRDATGAVLRPTLMLAIALGIAAPIVLPTLAISPELGRIPIPLEVLEQSAVPIQVFLKSAVPPATPPTEALLNGGAVFVGSVSAVLAIVGLGFRRPGRAVGAAIVLGTMLVCLGTPLDTIPYHIVPGFKYLTSLGRMLVFWCFGVALLAGLGLDTILRLGSRQHRWSGLPWAAVILAAVCVAGTGYQTMTVARRLNPPFQPRANPYLFPRTSAINALTAERDHRQPERPQRILPLRVNAPSLYASHAMMFEIESAAGYESNVIKRTADIWRVVAGESAADVSESPLSTAFIPSYSPSLVRYDLLPRVGVTTLYAPPDISSDPVWRQRRASPLALQVRYSGPEGSVFTIRSTPPRAFVVYRVERVTDARAALARYTTPSFPYRTTVLFDGNGTDAHGSQSAAPPTPARPVSRDENSSEWIVRAREPGHFVLLDTWAPGWHATVNGRQVAVQRANYAFRAVAVPAGRSVVRFEYDPPRFGLGLLVAAFTLGAIVVGALVFVLLRLHRPSLSFD
jgi:hypothetical protein